MNQRLFIQKKSNFDVISQKTTIELKNLVPTIVCKVFVIYDLFNIEESQLQEVQNKVFVDPSFVELTQLFSPISGCTE